MQGKYNFPKEIQRWVISKRLPKSNESLSDCGIKESGHTLYLYLVSAESAGVRRGPAQAWGGGDNRREPGFNRANSDTDLSAGHADQRLQNQAFNVPRNDPRSLPNMGSETIREAPQPVVGWSCPQCTYVNAPLRPGCEMCSADRPQNYLVPDDYVPDEKERRRLELEKTGERLILEVRCYYDVMFEKMVLMPFPRSPRNTSDTTDLISDLKIYFPSTIQFLADLKFHGCILSKKKKMIVGFRFPTDYRRG